MNAPFGYIEIVGNTYWIDAENEWQGEGDPTILEILRTQFPIPDSGWDPETNPAVRMKAAAEEFGMKTVGVKTPEFAASVLY